MAEQSRRILYCVPTLGLGGSEKRVVQLSNEAARRGWAVRLVAGTVGERASDCLPEVDLVSLNVTGRFSRALPQLRRTILEFRPDVFHGFVQATWFGAMVARVCRVPAVVGSLPTGADNIHGVWGLVGRLTAPFSHCLTANSQRAYDSYRRLWKVPAKRLELIPNSLRTAEYPCRDAAARAEVRAELGLVADQRVVISVGRLEHYKGHRFLLEAAATAQASWPDTAWVLVGDGPARPELEAQAEGLGLAGQVKFLGTRADVPRLLQGADLFVLPSMFEGMPNALLEAMAAGLPAVSTDVAGTDELIEQGVTGWRVPVADAPAMGAALVPALADVGQLATMGLAARRRAETEFDEEVVMPRYFALYERLLSGRR